MTPGPTVGVLSPLAGGNYFGAVLSGIARTVWQARGRVVSLQTLAPGTDPGPTVRTPDFRLPVARGHIDGYIAMHDSVETDYLAKLDAEGIPIVLVSHDRPELRLPSVRPNNASGIRRAVAHLVAHGHHRIGFVGALGPDDLRERYAAYLDALAHHGIAADPRFLFEVDDAIADGGHDAAAAMVAAGLPTSAVIAATDLTALGLIRGLTAAGISLPRQQAIIGFDDQNMAAWVSPSLTSVGQRFGELGAMAADLLLRALRDEHIEPRRYELGSSPLVLRQSCGCTGTETVMGGTVPATTATGTQDDPDAARLCALLRQRIVVAPDPPDGDQEQLAALSATVTSAVRARLADSPRQSSPAATVPASVWERFYAMDPRQATVTAVVQCVRAVAQEIAAASGMPGADTVPRLDPLLHEMVLDLARAQMTALLNENGAVESLLSQQYALSMDLLRSHVADPRDMGWLAFTHVRAGCFGIWHDDDTDELDIVGDYGMASSLVGRRVRVTDFPPTEMSAGAGDAPDSEDCRDVVFVLRVKGARDWGLLVIAGPIDSHVATGRETSNQWAALLAVALDHQEVLGSLQDQREDLASAYHRERDLVETIRISEQRYALAAQAANDGLWDWDLDSGSVFLSSRWKAMLGYGEGEIGTDPAEWLARVHPDDLGAFERAIAGHLGDSALPLEHEHRLLERCGSYRWMLCRGLAVRDTDGVAVRLVGSLTDITERRRLEEQLRHDAHYDALTDLPNRTLFLERLDRALTRAKGEPDVRSAVLWLDLDGFKVVNDSLGHLVGNELLVKVAERLAGFLREGDTAARFGGDEFAVLLEDLRDVNDLTGVARRLQRLLAAPFLLGEHEVVVTASIGIALGLAGYASSDDVLRDADIAMYRAKAEGKGTHSVFDSEMHTHAVSRLRTENELRQAVEHHELALHYQPIVRLATGEQSAVEALIRWQHPQRGLLLPKDFLPIAEESGLVVATGQWVLTEACGQIQQWQSAVPEGPAPRVSVNLSNKQFWHVGLIESIDRTLRLSGADPRTLKIEITEGVVMHNPEAARTKLRQLADRGLRLHIDDFGTGYSSLEALHRFPIEALKVDRSFVARLDLDSSDGTSIELLRTIVAMGRNLGMDVIAEGVETENQLATLRDMGCDFGQGRYFSEPRRGELAWPAPGMVLEQRGGVTTPPGAVDSGQ